MFLALASGGTASVSALQLLLRRPSLQEEPALPVDVSPGDTDEVDGASMVHIHHIELGSERPSSGSMRDPLPSRTAIRTSAVDLSVGRSEAAGVKGDFWRMPAGELGNLVAGLYRDRGDTVEFLPDPASGTVELMVLVKGRRRVVLCVAGGREVSPPVVRELVGTQRIEHADDATLVSTGVGTESALSLATEQAVQWIGPAELESWMKLRKAA